MSQQNGGFPEGQQPRKDQESTSATPHVFPFGGQQPDGSDSPQGSQPAPQQGGTPPGQWAQPAGSEQWAPQGSSAQQWAQPQQGQPDQWAQPQQQWQQQNPPQYGQAPQGSQPQAWGQEQLDQQWAQQQGQMPPQPYGQQPYPGDSDQWGQAPAAFGSGPQHQNYGQPEQYGQPVQQPGPHGQTQSGPPQQWSDPNAVTPSQPQQENRGNQQFSGILDPHTGEIHPVPDLQNLDETDALLVVVSGPDAGAQILLDTDVVTVGRSPNADIFLDDVTVSRKHAEFVRTPSGFTLRDTGSLNGTYVGRQLIDSIELQNGADVQIGKFRMIFQQRPRTS